MDVGLGDLCEGARIVLDRLGEEGTAWIVGGWVRDRIAEKDSEDLDLASNLIPSEVKNAFPRSRILCNENAPLMQVATRVRKVSELRNSLPYDA